MASALCRSSTSVKTSTLMIPHFSSAFRKIRNPKTKKPTVPGSLACGLRNSVFKLQLSPETPLARDGARATRSVARARTTHRLAAVSHQGEEYFAGLPEVKGSPLQRLDASHSKK